MPQEIRVVQNQIREKIRVGKPYFRSSIYQQLMQHILIVETRERIVPSNCRIIA